jgi:hypothetical protein
LDANEIAALYAARWEIELIFKELKSRYALDMITTKSPYAIEALIWISILTLLISRKVYSVIRKLNPDAKMVRFSQLRWSTIFIENSSRLLSAILDYLGIEQDFFTVLSVYSSEVSMAIQKSPIMAVKIPQIYLRLLHYALLRVSILSNWAGPIRDVCVL